MKSIYFVSSFWDDDFIFSLSINAKLFYIFLITNQNVLPSGLYKLGKIEKLKAGLTQTQIKKAFQELNGKIYMFGEWIFIKNLLYKSFLENSTEEKFLKSNIHVMLKEQFIKNEFPVELVEIFIKNYQFLKHLKPLTSPLQDQAEPLLHTDTDTDTNTDTKPLYVPPKGNECREYPQNFKNIWEKYPRKREKQKAYKAYKTRIKQGIAHNTLFQAVKHYAELCELAGKEQRHIKHAKTFFGPDRVWADWVDGIPDGELPQKKPTKTDKAEASLDPAIWKD